MIKGRCRPGGDKGLKIIRSLAVKRLSEAEEETEKTEDVTLSSRV